MSEEKNLSQPKILIVDDDKFLIDMYSMKFAEQGFEVVSAFSGEEALEQVEAGFSPDVALVDIIMPAMDGFEVIERLRVHDNSQNTALVVLSNLGQKDDIDKGLKSGADGYIVKANATPSEVVAKVKDIINQKNEQ